MGGFGAIIGFLSVVLATVIGSAITSLIISPLIEMRNLTTRVEKDLTTHRNIITNPDGSTKESRIDKANMTLRKDASELTAKADAVPAYRLWSSMQLVPPRENVKQAHEKLIFLSNSLSSGDSLENDSKIKEIEDLLNI